MLCVVLAKLNKIFYVLSNEHGLNPHGAIEAQVEKCDHHKEIALIKLDFYYLYLCIANKYLFINMSPI